MKSIKSYLAILSLFMLPMGSVSAMEPNNFKELTKYETIKIYFAGWGRLTSVPLRVERTRKISRHDGIYIEINDTKIVDQIVETMDLASFKKGKIPQEISVGLVIDLYSDGKIVKTVWSRGSYFVIKGSDTRRRVMVGDMAKISPILPDSAFAKGRKDK